MPKLTKLVGARFWAKIEKTQTCWIWKAGKTPAGYGRFKIKGTLYSPHRLVYEWFIGPIPEGFDVCHHCDNPSCVNPAHLFVGTRSDNMHDAFDKGRLISFAKNRKPMRGEESPCSKLTANDVRAIRKQYKSGSITQRDLGKRYKVHRRTIGKIINRQLWGHLID